MKAVEPKSITRGFADPPCDGMPTTIGVPFKADAGMVTDKVSGAKNLLATETQAFPL
jgi:hypothetical protein